jgi:predicted nucleic acid-binding protein
MAYLLDSNVFIEAKNSYYGFDFAPGFWEWLNKEHANENVFSIQMVRDELIGGDDELADWAKARGNDFFLPPDNAMLPSLATIAAWAQGGRYEAGAANLFLQAADYYLVAHAHAHGFDVVTHEKVSTSTKKIKIPDACIAHNVKALNTFQVLRIERARLVLGT